MNLEHKKIIDDAVDKYGKISVAYLMCKLKIDFVEASRLVEQFNHFANAANMDVK